MSWHAEQLKLLVRALVLSVFLLKMLGRIDVQKAHRAPLINSFTFLKCFSLFESQM